MQGYPHDRGAPGVFADAGGTMCCQQGSAQRETGLTRLLHAAICTLIFIFFFGESLISYGVLPDLANFVPELVILGLCAVISVKRASHEPQSKPVGLPFVYMLVGVTILSAIWMERSPLSVVLFLRLLVRFYLLYWAVIRFEVSEERLRWYLSVVMILMVIQIPTAAVKCAIYGQGESAIGTYATSGGGNSTAIPMVAAGFLLTYHWTYRRSHCFLFGIVAFTAFGLIGGKRAVFVMVPLTCFLTAINAHDFALGDRHIPIRHYVLAGVAGVIIFYVGVRLCPTLTPEGEVWGSFDLDHVYSYVVQYGTGESQDGYTIGRFSSTLRSVESVIGDGMTAAMGFGPGRAMKSRFAGAGREQSIGVRGGGYMGGDAELGIMYGTTGFSWLLLQIGFVGAVVWLGLYVYLGAVLRRMARQEGDPFWRSYYLSMVCFTIVVVLLSITYGSYMIAGDLMTFLYFLLLGIGFLRKKEVEGTELSGFVDETFSGGECYDDFCEGDFANESWR